MQRRGLVRQTDRDAIAAAVAAKAQEEKERCVCVSLTFVVFLLPILPPCRKKERKEYMSVTDWVTYMHVYIMAVAIVPSRMTPALLMTYLMTMMEVWSQIQRRTGVAFTKAFMVRCEIKFYFVAY